MSPPITTRPGIPPIIEGFNRGEDQRFRKQNIKIRRPKKLIQTEIWQKFIQTEEWGFVL